MEKLTLVYTMKVIDEFGRYFESYGKIDASYLLIKETADPIYSEMMTVLASPILYRMGMDATAEWTVEVTEEF